MESLCDTGIQLVAVKFGRKDSIPFSKMICFDIYRFGLCLEGWNPFAPKIIIYISIFDYLVGEGINSNFDKKTLQRINDIDLLEDDKKKTLYDVIDTFIREAKGRKAFAS